MPRRAAFWIALLSPLTVIARGGGGEYYTGPSGGGGGGGDGDFDGELLLVVLELLIRYPKVMIPLLIIAAIAWFGWQAFGSPTARTKKAFAAHETAANGSGYVFVDSHDGTRAGERTRINFGDVPGWVNALKLKDPSFELEPLLEKVRSLFNGLQEAWFRRDLKPIRPFLSDATYERFNVQLELYRLQGVRDAIADWTVHDVQLIGLQQTDWFDSIHIRVVASMRDTDVSANTPDAQALAAARRVQPQRFTEVWTFVRKPGTKTRIGEDLYQGKCPNCGAPWKDGPGGNCEFCGAIVNSGNYDWTLSEITQGQEHVRYYNTVDGLADAREKDPALNLEILEDRASLLFWKWVDAQTHADPARMSKLATGDYLSELQAEVKEDGKQTFLECAVGAVHTRELRVDQNGYDEAHVEVRWSARIPLGATNGRKPPPSIPQRSMLVLARRSGAKTSIENGMSTSRCGHCNAPLTKTTSPSCDYCGALLAAGERDWVALEIADYEAWAARDHERYDEAVRTTQTAKAAEVQLYDLQERERLLYMMASVAASDGDVSRQERKLLQLCARRWSVAWENVELAMESRSNGIFRSVGHKGSPQAEVMLRSLVNMAMIDGKVDRREAMFLRTAAGHLGLEGKLPDLLRSAASAANG